MWRYTNGMYSRTNDIEFWWDKLRASFDQTYPNTNYYYYRYFSPSVKKTITKEYDGEGNCIRKTVVVQELSFNDGVPEWKTTESDSTDYKTLEMPLKNLESAKPDEKVEEPVEEKVEEKPKPKRRRKTKDIPPPDDAPYTNFIMK